MPQFVVKVASRCNIACKYCYMYFRGDDQSLRRSKFLSRDNVTLLGVRLAEFLGDGDDSISLSLHGGEPLLYGVERTRHFLETIKSSLKGRVRFTVQTNGLLLNEQWYQLLGAFDVSIGISLDGTREVHDRNRLRHNGSGTFHQTLKAIQTTQRQNGVRFGGIISVLDDPTIDPLEYYALIKSLEIPAFNVLLPDVDHDNYHSYNHYPPVEYSKFLKTLFDAWFDDDYAPHNRLFEAIVSKIVGGKSGSEVVGAFTASSIIIETDGTIQAHDVARINALAGLSNFTLSNSTIDNFIKSDPLYMSATKSSFERKNIRCKECPIFHICRAGFWVHRYSQTNGYENHSVYCDALFDLISHIYFKLLSTGGRSADALIKAKCDAA